MKVSGIPERQRSPPTSYSTSGSVQSDEDRRKPVDLETYDCGGCVGASVTWTIYRFYHELREPPHLIAIRIRVLIG